MKCKPMLQQIKQEEISPSKGMLSQYNQDDDFDYLNDQYEEDYEDYQEPYGQPPPRPEIKNNIKKQPPKL